MKVKVGINGYGTIGKRVACAVKAQDDMQVVGVTKTRPSYEASLAAREGFPLYAASAENVAAFEKEGIKVAGTLEDLLKKADVIVDATPGGVGEEYRPLYDKAGVKVIYQGGEEHNLAGISFNAYANYKEAWGAQHARVVSCNTTGLVRTLFPLDQAFGLGKVNATIVRRGADASDIKGSALNALEPSLHLPTHHGPDVQTIMRGLSITTMAVKAPTTLMHVHCIAAELKKTASDKDVLAVWENAPRVKLISGKQGIKSTGQVLEFARDMKRERGDLMEIAVWSDGLKVQGNTLFYYQAVHQESDVVPENVDCIRSMMQLEPDGLKSIAKTDKALGISKD